MNKYLIKILKKMCKMVGANYKFINFKKDDWYTEYQWSQKQEEKFGKWLVKYFYKNRKAREELTLCWKDKKIIKRYVDFFIMNYGWKNKE